MTKHAHSEAQLTRNQSMVMNALSRASSPMSAYTILDELREEGFRAPLQVYRALDKLVEFGMVHRLESLNAFVACQHPACEGERKDNVLFMICEDCGSVQERVNDAVIEAVTGLARSAEFSPKSSVIELRGTCSGCRD